MNNILTFTITIVLIFLFAVVSDLVPFFMPMGVQMLIFLLIAVLISIFSGLVLKESYDDEREMIHVMNAGRYAYLAGIIFLTVALLWQGIKHNVDPWICGGLAVMVATKFVARAYLNKYR